MSNSDSLPSEEFAAAFAAAAGAAGTLSFAAFMALALYHPRLGYYRRAGPRVGYGAGTDFFTASSSPVFGELVAAACVQLLETRAPGGFEFVEIGAEPAADAAPATVLAGAPHPFAGARAIGIGTGATLAGAQVVFSNELFDAQPCRRFVFRGGAWRETGVALEQGRLVEVEVAGAVPVELPETAPEGYRIDAPLAAVRLLEQIAAQPWTGLLVACDYGKSWRELTEAAPGGTVRAYWRHTQVADLFARPGEQDLTCHVCWDWLQAALVRHGFESPTVESQEMFFVRHAAAWLEQITKTEAGRFSPRKQGVAQLLHPAHLGQKFQVLHAGRWAT